MRVSCHIPRRVAGDGGGRVGNGRVGECNGLGDGLGGGEPKPVRAPCKHEALGVLEEVPKVCHKY